MTSATIRRIPTMVQIRPLFIPNILSHVGTGHIGESERPASAKGVGGVAAVGVIAASGVARLNAPPRTPPAAWRGPVPTLAMLLIGVGGAVAGLPDKRRRKRAARARAGLCPECGYDLRVSPERCSECAGGKEQSLISKRVTERPLFRGRHRRKNLPPRAPSAIVARTPRPPT